MATTSHTHNTGQLDKFTNNLWRHQQKNQFCDFTLTTNNTSIECHKLVLSSASSYFSRLLCNSEYNTNIIDVTPLPENILSTVVAFMYNSAYVIDDENVVELLKLSDSWNLDILVTLCVSFINNNVTINNVCRFYNFTLDTDDMNQFESLNKFIREHFKILHESNKLCQLPLKNFIEIIGHDEINVDNEDVIFSNAVQIIEKQTSAEDTRRCLELIRYPHISSNYLIEVVQEHPLLKKNPQNGYVRKALKYHINKSPTQTVKPRRTWNDGTCTYYIALDKYVYRYETKDGKDMCTEIKDLNEQDVCGSAVALHEYRKCIIIVGGMRYSSSQLCSVGINFVKLQDITTNKHVSRSLPDLPERVFGAGIALSENHVYVMGGLRNNSECINSLFCLSLVNERWRKERPMLHALRYPLAVHHQNFLYVLGGIMDNMELQSSVSKYNIRYDRWERCRDMPVSCISGTAGVVVHKGKVKVITTDKCLVYDENTDSWSVKHFNTIGERVNAFVKQGQICAAVPTYYYGPQLSTIQSHRVMCYDDVMNKWRTVKKIDNRTSDEKFHATNHAFQFIFVVCGCILFFVYWVFQKIYQNLCMQN